MRRKGGGEEGKTETNVSEIARPNGICKADSKVAKVACLSAAAHAMVRWGRLFSCLCYEGTPKDSRHEMFIVK